MKLNEIKKLPKRTYNGEKSLADIPNKHGFEFIGITKDGKEVHSIVKKGGDGTHSSHDKKTGEKNFKTLSKWRHIK